MLPLFTAEISANGVLIVGIIVSIEIEEMGCPALKRNRTDI
jgi:hypothetical protein